MKRKRYSVEHIVAAVKQHELGTSVPDICRKLGNAKLKKLVADLSLDKAMLQDVASKSGERAAE